jgi:UDP-glucose 4-epimerase
MGDQTYLITGGAGFIGSHLADALLARGDRVVALDNLSTGRLSNLDRAGTNPNFRFVQGSVLDELMVDELVHECDVVVHLAAAVGVKLIVERPLRSLTTNIRGSEIVMEATHRYRRKILVTSTSEIYGKNTSVLSETSDRILGSPAVARWAYSTSKAVDEILAYAYHKERGLSTVVVRLFNTVGPRQSAAYGMVIPRLVRQAVAGKPLTVYGDGKQTRCFCHVADVVNALLLLLDNPAASGEVFNVGSTEEISIIDLARRIAELTGNRSTAELIPYDRAYEAGFEDMLRRVPNTTKLSKLTGWKVQHGLDEILRQSVHEAELELEREQSQQVLERT